MIRKIIGLTIASLAITPIAYAHDLRSPLGISQAEWNASATYQNFQCPAGTSRGEGVDMNFTTTRSDDFWFVKCNPTPVYVAPIPVAPTPSVLTPVIPSDTATATTPAPQPVQSATTPAPQPVQSATPTLTPAPIVIDTSTASTAPSITTVVTDTPTAVVKTSILDEELNFTWDWEKILEWIIAWFEKIWIKL
jgi:hypothetical protein